MYRFSPRLYAILTIAIVLLAAAGIGIFVIVPAVRGIVAIDRSIQEIEHYIERQYAKTKLVRRSIQRLPEITAFTKELEHAAIDTGQELTLITLLEDLAEAHGVDQTLEVKKHPPAGESATGIPAAVHMPYYTVAFVTRGRFENLLTHVRAIETLPTFVLVPSLAFDAPQTPKDGHTVTARFTGYIFARSSI